MSKNAIGTQPVAATAFHGRTSMGGLHKWTSEQPEAARMSKERNRVTG